MASFKISVNVIRLSFAAPRHSEAYLIQSLIGSLVFTSRNDQSDVYTCSVRVQRLTIMMPRRLQTHSGSVRATLYFKSCFTGLLRGQSLGDPFDGFCEELINPCLVIHTSSWKLVTLPPWHGNNWVHRPATEGISYILSRFIGLLMMDDQPLHHYYRPLDHQSILRDDVAQRNPIGGVLQLPATHQ